MKKYDKILTIGLFILEIIYFVLIKQLPERAARYPFFVLGLMVILTLLLAIETFVLKNTSNEEEEDKFKDIKLGQFFGIILISAAYVAIIDIVGFFISTAVYLFVVMVGLKSNLKWSIIVSVVFPIFLYLVFVLFLRVPVPRGFLI